jgi:hypothetical protein
MIIFDQNQQVLAESGTGADYQTFMEIVVPQKGELEMCFEKEDGPSLDVHFDIIREEDQLQHVGREDLGKMTRRIG